MIIFEPYKPINRNVYKCDLRFHIDDIVDMYKNDIVNGVVYVDGKECSFYTVNDNFVKRVKNDTMHLQKKFGRGGSSHERLRRIGEQIRESSVNQIIEAIVGIFYDKKNNRSKISNLLVCGPATLKYEIGKSSVVKQYFSHVHVLAMQHFSGGVVVDFFSNLEDPIYRKNLDDVKQMISLGDERLVFGGDIFDRDKIVGVIYVDVNCDVDEISEFSQNIEIKRVPFGSLDMYGQKIGVKWF